MYDNIMSHPCQHKILHLHTEITKIVTIDNMDMCKLCVMHKSHQKLVKTGFYI